MIRIRYHGGLLFYMGKAEIIAGLYKNIHKNMNLLLVNLQN